MTTTISGLTPPATTVSSPVTTTPYILSPRCESRYRIRKELGRGSYATVFEATDLETRQQVALKVMTSFRRYHREKHILGLAKGVPHTLPLLDAFEDPDFYDHPPCDRYVLVFPLFQGTLRDIRSSLAGNLAKTQRIGDQLFTALHGLHARGITHGDVSLRNIGFSKRNLSQIYLCDFGFSYELDGIQDSRLGTAYFRAPEEFLGCERSFAIDLWSAGCVLGECFTGAHLFPGTTDLHFLQLIIQRRGLIPTYLLDSGRRTERFLPHLDSAKVNLSAINEETSRALAPLSCDIQALRSFQDLLGRLLEVDPRNRLSSIQAREHPFFTGLMAITVEVPKEVSLGSKHYLHISDFERRCTAPDDLEGCTMLFHDLTRGQRHRTPFTFLCRPMPKKGCIAEFYDQDRRAIPDDLYSCELADRAIFKINEKSFRIESAKKLDRHDSKESKKDPSKDSKESKASS